MITESIKGIILAFILLYASVCDIKTRKVSDSVAVMILILSFVGFKEELILNMILGGIIVFLPQLIISVINPDRSIGGADIKISSSLAFLLGVEKGVFAFIIGMLFAVIVMTIYKRIKANNSKEAFPLIPFLSVGTMLTYII